MATVHRDHLNLVNIEKRLKRGRVGVREHSNSPQRSRSLRAEVYIQSNAKKRGFYAFVLAQLELAGAEKPNCLRLCPKKCGPFSVLSSRYLDRGRVWIVGTEDSERTARSAISCSGTQVKLPEKENLYEDC